MVLKLLWPQFIVHIAGNRIKFLINTVKIVGRKLISNPVKKTWSVEQNMKFGWESLRCAWIPPVTRVGSWEKWAWKRRRWRRLWIFCWSVISLIQLFQSRTNGRLIIQVWREKKPWIISIIWLPIFFPIILRPPNLRNSVENWLLFGGIKFIRAENEI